MKWYIHVILLGPPIGLLFTIRLNFALGCSEYPKYSSDLCKTIESFLGIDLYWGIVGLVFLFFYLSILSVPAALFVYIYRAINRRKK